MTRERLSNSRGQHEGTSHQIGRPLRGKPGGQTLTAAFPAPPSDDVDALERLQRHLADLGHREAKLIAALQKQDLREAQIIGESIGMLRTCLNLLIHAAQKRGVEEAEVPRLDSDSADALGRMATLAELAKPATQPKDPAARAADAKGTAPAARAADADAKGTEARAAHSAVEVTDPLTDVEGVGHRLRGPSQAKTVRSADAAAEGAGVAQQLSRRGPQEPAGPSTMAVLAAPALADAADDASGAAPPLSAPPQAVPPRDRAPAPTAATHAASSLADVNDDAIATSAAPLGAPVQAAPQLDDATSPRLATDAASSLADLADLNDNAITVDVGKLAVRYRASWLLVNPRERALLGLQRLRHAGAISWASDAALARVVAGTAGIDCPAPTTR